MLDEITTKEKKATKKVKPISRGKVPKKEKSFSHTEESDKEKQEYGKRHALI